MNKTEVLSIRLTEKEKRELQRKATAERRTISGFIRCLIQDAALDDNRGSMIKSKARGDK